MYCTKCGAQIPEGSASCNNCKIIIPPPPSQPPNFSALPPDATFPVRPGSGYAPRNPTGGTQPSPYAQPQDYLTHNIIITIVSFMFSCFCINNITGIIGIIFASNARSAFARGDYAAGTSAANTARLLFIVSLVFAILAVIVIIIYVIVFFFFMGTAGGANLPGMPRKI